MNHTTPPENPELKQSFYAHLSSLATPERMKKIAAPKITVAWIKENVIGVDAVSRRNGNFILRRCFYYTHGQTAQSVAQDFIAQIPGAKL